MKEIGQQERQKRILDAAANLITHYGYDKTTVDEIARDAGVSKGAIYLHFKSKEALFEALLLREADAIVERFFALIDADPNGVTLFNMYRYSLMILDESPLLKAIYTRDRRVLGDYVRHLRDHATYGQVMNLSIEVVRHFQEAGLLRRDLDAEVVTYLLGALRYGVLMMDDITPKEQQSPSVAQMGDVLAEMLSNGLAPREGESDQESARQALQQLVDVRYRLMEEQRNKRR